MKYPKKDELIKMTSIILGTCIVFGTLFTLIDSGVQLVLKLF